VADGAPQAAAERRYEQWVMRAAKLVCGDYFDDKEEAERVLLLQMRDALVGCVPPSNFWVTGGSTPEELGEYFSNHGADRVEAACSLVSALYSAAGGDEWSLVVKPEEGGDALSVSVRGVSQVSPDHVVHVSVDVRSLVCEDADDLRALHQRAVRELPKRKIDMEEAANVGIVAMEEMRGIVESMREISDTLDTWEEMRDLRVALDNLSMVLAGIAAAEQDRRFRGEDSGSTEGQDTLKP
jgi:hypothetical protein